MKKLLVVVDMQNDFVTGCLGTPEARAIVPARSSLDMEQMILNTAMLPSVITTTPTKSSAIK